MVSKRKKSKGLKREDKLHNKAVSKRFVVLWGFIDDKYGVFFALSAKLAGTVLRNRIKRVFREIIRRDIGAQDHLNICLVAKKNTRLERFTTDVRDELEELVSKIVKSVR